MSAGRAAAALLAASIVSVARADDSGSSKGLEVSVRGDPLAPRATDEPVASSSIVGEALLAPGATIADAVETAPSVRLGRTGSGDDVTTIGLRGATTAETPVYLGSVRLNDDVTGAADVSTVPLFFLRRIDVFRGNGPVELGPLGLGGAVVLSPALPSAGEIRAGAGYGSFGETSAFAAASGGTEHARAGLAVRIAHADNDYELTDDRGTRFDPSDDVERRRHDADATTADVYGVGRANLGERASVALLVNTFSREQGVTGLGVAPATRARATTRRQIAELDTVARCADDARDDRCRIETSAFAKVTSYLVRDPLFELPFGTKELAVDGSEAGFRAAVRGRPLAPLEGVVGVEQIVDLLSVDPAGPTDLRARRASSRGFARASLTAKDVVTFDLALSMGSARTSGPGSAPDFLSPEVRGGIRVRPLPELDLYANGARYVRIPTLGESYGASDTVLGNPELVPERGPTFESGARFSRAFRRLDLVIEGVFFSRWASDLIAYRRSSFGALRPYNVGSARVLGGEGTAAARVLGILTIDGSVTVTDARDMSAPEATLDDRLPFVATFAGAAGVHADLRALGAPARPFGIVLGTTFVGRSPRKADSVGLVQLPAQLSWDADVALTLARGTFVVRARVSNLLDDRSTDAVGYPLPGRAGHLTMETVLR